MAAGMEPAAAGCVVGVLVGGDTGQFDPAMVDRFVPGPVRGFAVMMRSVWWGRASRQASCWVSEGTTVGRLVRWLLLRRQARPGHPYRLVLSGVGVRWVAWWVAGWLLVENCTVDASILFSVVKLSRADGGCLGARSR